MITGSICSNQCFFSLPTFPRIAWDKIKVSDVLEGLGTRSVPIGLHYAKPYLSTRNPWISIVLLLNV